MKASGRDRFIAIEQKTETRDSAGGFTKAWNTFANAWANYRPMTARDRYMSASKHSIREAVFTILWIPGVDQTMRINFDGFTWQISGIAEIGRREGLQITAEAIVGGND